MLKKFFIGFVVILMMGFSLGCEQPTDNPGGGGGGYEQPSGGSGGQQQPSGGSGGGSGSGGGF